MIFCNKVAMVMSIGQRDPSLHFQDVLRRMENHGHEILSTSIYKTDDGSMYEMFVVSRYEDREGQTTY